MTEPCAAERCDFKAITQREATIEGVDVLVYLCAFHNDRIAASEHGREPLYETIQDAPNTHGEHLDDLASVD